MTIRMTGGSVPGGAFCALIDTPHVASFGHNDATRNASFGSDFGHQLRGAMTESPAAAEPRRLSLELDPRHSLAAAAMWLIIGLAATFSIAAAVWVGKIARENVIEQHVRRLSLETEQFSSDLGQAMAARLGAVRAARSLLRSSADSDPHQTLLSLFDELASAYPELEWIAVADSHGIIVNSRGLFQKGAGVESSRWFSAGVQGPWLGRIAGAAL